MNRNLIVTSALLFVCACAQTTIEEEESTGAASAEFSVAPSDDLLLSVSLDDGEVKGVMEAQGDEASALKFSMSRMGENATMMSVENQLDQIVKFDLYMIDYRGKEHYTSSCPVMAGGSVFENWPHRIPRIVVRNIRVLADGSSMTCK